MGACYHFVGKMLTDYRCRLVRRLVPVDLRRVCPEGFSDVLSAALEHDLGEVEGALSEDLGHQRAKDGVKGCEGRGVGTMLIVLAADLRSLQYRICGFIPYPTGLLSLSNVSCQQVWRRYFV